MCVVSARLVEKAKERGVNAGGDKSPFKVKGPVRLPTRRLRITCRKSPCGEGIHPIFLSLFFLLTLPRILLLFFCVFFSKNAKFLKRKIAILFFYKHQHKTKHKKQNNTMVFETTIIINQ